MREKFFTWTESDLRTFLKRYGKRAMIDLLATTGDLYASKRLKGKGWVIYLARLREEEYWDEEERKLSTETGTYLGDIMQFLKFNPVGETFLFSLDGESCPIPEGEVEYDSWGDVILRQSPAKHTIWTSILSKQKELYTPAPTTEDILNTPVTFFFPQFIDLPACPHERRDLQRYLKRKKKSAAIFYIPDVWEFREGMKVYRRMGCVVSKEVERIRKWFEDNPERWESPAPLYTANALTTEWLPGLTEEHILRRDKEVFLTRYRWVPLYKHINGMAKAYYLSIRYGHGDAFIDLDREDEKEEKAGK